MTTPIDIREISVPALAYLGDCVIELCVRRYLVTELGLSTSAHLNEKALDYVRAPMQAEAMKHILPHLTDEEAAYFRRGRNMGHSSVPKRASVSEYRTATGMETLFGYLHLTGQTDRINTLFSIAYGIDLAEK
ncbi:MAG: ribonuclease III [Clostridia bacterium]|nr:ribonuclease III [Clostridia bacterium]